MRSRLSAPTALLFLLSTILLLTSAARAAEDTNNTDDEYEERARVLRVSLLKGEVSLKRAGSEEWEDARLNLPLVEGDVLATGRDSRLEIQADARNFVRVGSDSVLRVVTLRDEGIALSLTEGTVTFRLARLDKAREYFELDAPGVTVAPERVGLYRVDIERDGAVRVTVRDDGRASIYSKDSGFVLRNNRSARLAPDGKGEADWEFMAVVGFDEWDVWNDERERYLAERLKFEGRERYYDSDVYGAEELDAYGDWSYHKDYGYIWRPHTTVVNVYNDWAPYRYGQWVWCPPYGWTWVGDEPWGWAPYHYGRWVYVNGYWCWAPRGYGYPYRRAWWRPALVAFVTLGSGYDSQVCWYPLTYGQRDPRGRHYSRAHDRLSPLRGRDLAHLRRQNPHWLRAVSTVPAREFGDRTLRARPAAGDLAGRALTGEPVRGQLPIARATRVTPRVGAGDAGARPTGAQGRDTLTINRPTPVMAPRALPDRPTGAAARTPGVPLDGELRRTRVFNNREPRMPSAPDASVGNSPTGSGPVGGDAGASTGAFERPRSNGTPSTNPGSDSARPARVRPTRPDVPAEPSPGYPTGDDAVSPKRRERDTGGGDNGQPRVRPTRPSNETPSETPAETRPSEDSSSPVYRPRHEPRIRPREEEGGGGSPAPARREAPPSYTPEPSAPRESPAPRREAPETRREAPREAPRHEAPRSEPRHEAPRQEPRHEAPRSEPRQEAPRQAPPPRQETPRQEAPRARDPDTPHRKSRPDNR